MCSHTNSSQVPRHLFCSFLPGRCECLSALFLVIISDPSFNPACGSACEQEPKSSECVLLLTCPKMQKEAAIQIVLRNQDTPAASDSWVHRGSCRLAGILPPRMLKCFWEAGSSPSLQQTSCTDQPGNQHDTSART